MNRNSENPVSIKNASWMRHKKKTKYHSTIVFALAIFLSSLTSDASNRPMDILIVANKNVKTEKISIGDLRNIFLKDQLSWRAGNKAVPIHSSSSTLRTEFVKRVLNMDTISQEKMYWKKQKISHGVAEPPAFSNNLKAVFKLKGSVSYVYRNQYIEGVAKVLLVLPAN
ncbi:MAG: hypothetical protein GY854_29685 [Deltaproteobacteria bacterium]|nr:hypothetical protein [Deltaproteobacteria bacterium]